MIGRQRKIDIFTKERRAKLIEEIIKYFETKRGEEIGVLAAEDLLDFFVESVANDIRNHTVENAKLVVKQNFENMEVDLEMLINK